MKLYNVTFLVDGQNKPSSTEVYAEDAQDATKKIKDRHPKAKHCYATEKTEDDCSIGEDMCCDSPSGIGDF